MISIIICHRNKAYLDAVSASIAETIGVPYELVVVDNTQNEYSIFSAYNEGVLRSQFEICCFSHEDITFHTKDWGHKVLAHFADSKTGMIGLTGGLMIPAVPAAWWYNFHEGLCAVSLIERRELPEPEYHYLNPWSEQPRTEAAMADGLWFCIRRSLFDKIRFDEVTFAGFHLYDADISMQVRQYAKLYVVYDILVQHYSHGPTHKNYYLNLIAFTRKWQAQLPAFVPHLSRKKADEAGWYHLRRYLLEAAAAGFSREALQQVQEEFFPVLRNSGIWGKGYFLLLRLGGQRIANAVFERLERLRPQDGRMRVKKTAVSVD